MTGTQTHTSKQKRTDAPTTGTGCSSAIEIQSSHPLDTGNGWRRTPPAAEGPAGRPNLRASASWMVFGVRTQKVFTFALVPSSGICSTIRVH